MLPNIIVRTGPSTARIVFLILSFSFIVTASFSQQLTKSLRVRQSAINGVFIERNGALLAVYGDPENEIAKAEMVLFTHFRRDVVWAGKRLIGRRALGVGPASEKAYFSKVDSIWTAFRVQRFHDYSNQTTMVPLTSLKIERYVGDNDVVHWQDISFKVLQTPGYTRGSVSYIANIDEKKFAFTGDLIYGDGKVLDLFSFQDSLDGVDGYHGYAARLGQLISSLQLIASQKPDFIVPSRGPVITDPDTALQALMGRIRSLYLNYLSITAQRWNHPKRMLTLSNHVLGESNIVDWMPFAEEIRSTPPDWYFHLNSNKLVIAEDSSGFLIDCGSRRELDHLRNLKRTGRLKRLDGVFITHYHDDHTNLINEVVAEFGCPVYVTRELADILRQPGAFRMPCLTTNGIPNLTIMKEGEKMLWKEFTLTFLYFPGQTLYHDAVVFEKQGAETILFVGDSFTPAGIDDYCLQNRNILHEDKGYLYCLNVLKRYSNALLSNQHIRPLFAFSELQLDHMRNVLLDRNRILADLLPWDDINYGTDDQWIAVYPYSQKARRGQTIDYRVKVSNYSRSANVFTLTPKIPKGYRVEPKSVALGVDGLKQGEYSFKVTVSEEAAAGVSLLLFDVKFDEWDLREWSEGMIEIEGQ